MPNHPLIVFIGVIIGVFIAGLGAGQFLTNRNVDAEVERVTDAVKAEVKGAWEFSVPLYEKLPKDVDFIARDLRISRRKGARTTVHLPGGNHFLVELSQLHRRADGEYEVAFGIEGEFDGNKFYSRLAEDGEGIPIKVERGVLFGPINAVLQEFYVHIDDLTLDDITITVAKRKITTRVKVTGAVSADGEGFYFGGERPAPIVQRKPTQ